MGGRVVSIRLVSAIAAFSIFTFLAANLQPVHSTRYLQKSDLRLEGVLVYHRYSTYKAWDATLWMMRLDTGEMSQINKNWTSMLSPINAHISVDGESMTFMGSQVGLPQNEWDVFISHWNGSAWAEPINLTGPNGKRDEDPKFSPDGKRIVYKEDGVLTIMNADGSGKTYLTSGEAESSIPFFTPDGKGVIFERDRQIMLIKNGVTTALWNDPMLTSYYPVGIDEERYIFTQVQSKNYDRLMFGYYDGREAQPLFFNSTSWDTSDGYPYKDASHYVFYVSGDIADLHGGYNVMVADLKREQIASLAVLNPEANSDLQELGPAWSLKGKFPLN